MISSQCHFLAIMLQNVKALKTSFGFDSPCETKDGNTDPSHLLLVGRQWINPFLPFRLYPERTNPSSPFKASLIPRHSHAPPMTLTPHPPAELALFPATFSFHSVLRCFVFFSNAVYFQARSDDDVASRSQRSFSGLPGNTSPPGTLSPAVTAEHRLSCFLQACF